MAARLGAFVVRALPVARLIHHTEALKCVRYDLMRYDRQVHAIDSAMADSASAMWDSDGETDGGDGSASTTGPAPKAGLVVGDDDSHSPSDAESTLSATAYAVAQTGLCCVGLNAATLQVVGAAGVSAPTCPSCRELLKRLLEHSKESVSATADHSSDSDDKDADCGQEQSDGAVPATTLRPMLRSVRPVTWLPRVRVRVFTPLQVHATTAWLDTSLRWLLSRLYDDCKALEDEYGVRVRFAGRDYITVAVETDLTPIVSAPQW